MIIYDILYQMEAQARIRSEEEYMKHGHLKKKIGSLLLAAVLVAGTVSNSVPEAGRLIRKRSRQLA